MSLGPALGAWTVRVLFTERLELRWFGSDDAAFVLQLLNEPSWLQHIGDRQVRTLAQAQDWLQTRLFSGYWRQGMGFWAVCLRGQPQAVGLCGLIHRDTLPDVDVGYAFLPAFWGQGYAQEAARACLDYGQRVLGLKRILAITGPDNQASQNVLRRLGMQLEQRCTLPGETRETLVFVWQPTPSPTATTPANDESQIQALTDRFFRLFDNRAGAVPHLPSLPALCLPEVRFVKTGEGDPQVMDMMAFMQLRAALLSECRLQDFAEWELEGRTQVFGHMAQRWLRYAKDGLLDGKACAGQGCKSLQFVRTATGWRISAALWEDEPTG